MEPFDIDNIIKHKLGDKNNLHQDAMESAKPFIWEGIQHKISRRRHRKGYYLAAATLLLALSFSLVFYNLDQRHDQEIAYLKSQIDQMQLEYHEQNMKLGTKNVQLTTIEDQLAEIRQQLITLQNSSTQRPYQVKMITRTDTVYVPQVKYVTLQPVPAGTEVAKDTLAVPAILDKQDMPATEDAIFITSSSKPTDRSSETLKVKFGPFTRGN